MTSILHRQSINTFVSPAMAPQIIKQNNQPDTGLNYCEAIFKTS